MDPKNEPTSGGAKVVAPIVVPKEFQGDDCPKCGQPLLQLRFIKACMTKGCTEKLSGR